MLSIDVLIQNIFQATVALEFLDQCPNLDAILVSVGGGGLLAGVGFYTRNNSPNCKGKINLKSLYNEIYQKISSFFTSFCC